MALLNGSRDPLLGHQSLLVDAGWEDRECGLERMGRIRLHRLAITRSWGLASSRSRRGVGVGRRIWNRLPCARLVRKVKRSRVCELSKGNVDCSRVLA